MSAHELAATALAQGRALLDLGRAQEAVERLGDAVAAEPEEPEPRLDLARALLRAGRYEEALAAAEGAIALEPAWEWGHRLRASALARAGRPKQAVPAAREAVRLAGDEPLTHEVLGEVLLDAGDRRGAREAGEAALRLDPASAGAHHILADVDLAEKRLHAAEEHLRAALRLDPEDAMAHNNLGVVLQRTNRSKEAIACFETAARLDPHLRLARENLGESARALLTGGVTIAILSLPAIQGLRLLLGAEATGDRVVGGALLVAFVAVAAWVAHRGRARSAHLSAATQRVLDDQRWWQRWRVKRWRPWWWLIPSPVWFVLGALLTAAMAAGRFTAEDPWSVGDWVVIGVVAAATALAGARARGYAREKGWRIGG